MELPEPAQCFQRLQRTGHFPLKAEPFPLRREPRSAAIPAIRIRFSRQSIGEIFKKLIKLTFRTLCLGNFSNLLVHYGVGSEEARFRAGLRPPLKLPVRFSRMQLSQRCSPLKCKRKNQSHQIHQSHLAIQLGAREQLPTRTTPTIESMRPNAPHNPAIKSVEELSDVGSFEIVTPTSQ